LVQAVQDPAQDLEVGLRLNLPDREPDNADPGGQRRGGGLANAAGRWICDGEGA
jgi:hypothetical protein